MRFSPDGRHVAWTSGYGGGALSVVISDAATGAPFAVLPAGHDPCWLDSATLLARSHDGTPSQGISNGFACAYVPANDGDLSAANGRYAQNPDRVSGVRVHAAGSSTLFPHTFEPSLSPGGTVALRDLSSGILRLERAADATDTPARDVVVGACTRARWASQTLVADTIPFGAVLGRTSPDQPTTNLTVPQRACTHPVVWWTGRLLVVGLVLDNGELVLAEWGSLVRQESLGWPIGVSTGSAFDWDLAPVLGQPDAVRVAYLTPAGELALATVDLTRAPVSLAPQPKPPDPKPEPIDWSFVPDGILVVDAFRAMFGDNPSVSPDRERICLHKNVNEQEWREIDAARGVCFHLFDRSRYPGDVGWYLVGDGNPFDGSPVWAVDVFYTGHTESFNGEIVEMADGRRNRWTHTNTLYGLSAGGVCVQFDPRFPRQDYGIDKCYERMFNRLDGHMRWELWYTPDTPEARALPWGDRSLDVLKQVEESGPQIPGPPMDYIECPRLSVLDDPWAPVPEPPGGGDMTADDIRRYISEVDNQTLFGAMQRFHNEVLPRDRPRDMIITHADGGEMWTGDVTTGGAMAYLMRSLISEYIIARHPNVPWQQAWGTGYDKAIAAYRQAVDPQ